MVLAGGQTLIPLLNLRMSQPLMIVDVSRINALKGVARTAEGVRIGAMTRQAEVLASDIVREELPVLAEAVAHVGHHHTRNRGTIGGSIALGEPAAELPALAVALDAVIEVRSRRGERRIPAPEFYQAPYVTALESDELVAGIVFPRWPPGHRKIFRELAQRPGDFALLGLAGGLYVEGGRITRVGLAWFGMGPTPVRARLAESQLQGRVLAELDFDAVSSQALHETAPFDDHHASAAYRRMVGQRLAVQALKASLELREAV
jgi:carbon-monoxide dehydrogenase medium subunit